MPILRNKDLSVIQVLLFIALMIPISLLADNKISVQQAYKMASDNQIILIDIRSRGEWKESGVASVARPISMHESDFLPRFKQVLEEANGRPIALICAVGGRTSWLQKELTGRGVKNVLDVSEGMFGSRDGPGWVRSGLPVREYSEVVGNAAG